MAIAMHCRPIGRTPIEFVENLFNEGRIQQQMGILRKNGSQTFAGHMERPPDIHVLSFDRRCPGQDEEAQGHAPWTGRRMETPTHVRA